MTLFYTLTLTAFVVANMLAFLEWAARRDDDRAQAEARAHSIRHNRNRLRDYAKLAASYGADADRLFAQGLRYTAADSQRRADCYRARAVRAAVALAAAEAR